MRQTSAARGGWSAQKNEPYVGPTFPTPYLTHLKLVFCLEGPAWNRSATVSWFFFYQIGWADMDMVSSGVVGRRRSRHRETMMWALRVELVIVGGSRLVCKVGA